QTLCADGYMTIEETIPVPADFFGTQDTVASFAPVDPSPFNHPTKIVVLLVQKKGLPAIL
ncbi:MAG: SAM-dependent methyltransferase, partial [Anaerolineaceae bacterium]|nr:SAM-dependent methyltransferase [Anaerolineaceae bacterium]